MSFKKGYIITEEIRNKLIKNHRKYQTEETKRKISLSHKGKKFSEEHRKNMSLAKKGIITWMKGKHHTDESKLKLSISHIGKPNSSLTKFRKENPSWNKGIKYSEKMRKKISESHIGRYGGEKHPMYGRHHTEESKKLISDTRKRLFKEGKIIHKMLGKHHSGLSKEKISLALKGKFSGEKNSSWKGGISFEPYGLDFNNKLREKVRQRDNYTCQLCNDKIIERRRVKNNPSKNWLVIHHIDYNKKNNNFNNLITLCNFCNISVNKDREDWTKLFNEKLCSLNEKGGPENG